VEVRRAFEAAVQWRGEVLRLVAISSDRPILSVEKEIGITPLPLSAEFSPFFDPAGGQLISAGFATSLNAATAVRYACQQDEAAA
jgi:hypothetical protein